MIVYAATFMNKEVEEDSYEHGCQGRRSCVMRERLRIEAPSLPELIEKRDTLPIKLDEFSLAGITTH